MEGGIVVSLNMEYSMHREFFGSNGELTELSRYYLHYQ
jgi:hypothetical protein